MADLSVTATSVVAAAGATIVDGILGATTTAGQTAYKDTSAGTTPPTYGLCDADGADAVATLAGIFLTGGAAGQRCQVLVAGDWNPGGTVTVGGVYVTSDTAGGIAPVADLTSNWKTTIVGVATTASNVTFIGKSGSTLVAVP